MKNFRISSILLAVAMVIGMASCDDDIETPQTQQNIIPERFSVEIPESLTTGNFSNERITDSQMRVAEELSGNDIYEALRFFIRLGEASGNVVQDIISGIRQFNIADVIFLSYVSDDDDRVKNLEVFKGGVFEGKEYEYNMLVTDADSEGNVDGGKALQIYWNTDPISGVAILKPYNINRRDEARNPDAVYQIEYVDESDLGYESHMIVSISGLTLENPLEDPYSVDNLKMFVGKTGETVDLYGNSNHPNASFFTSDVGFNWAFVASGIRGQRIGVAEVGLPPSNLDADDRETLLIDYSIKQVFTDQILELWPNLPQDLIDQYLANTEAPGYFGEGGFIQGGTSPGTEWDPLVDRIQNLVPFNPSEISDLSVQFE